MKYDYEKMTADELNDLCDKLLTGADGVEKDVSEAVAVSKIAAEMGDAKAQFSYACFLLDGKDVERDDAAAGDYWRRSAAQGYAHSVNRLGICALHGICGEKKDPVRAAEYFKLAADAGLPDAMFNLCMLYDSGVGVEKDAENAYNYMKMAADKKFPAACVLFGMKLAFESASSQEDREKGAEYILTAAEAGNHDGEMLCAVCCEKGIGVEKDLSEAAGWYRRAAKAGNVQANDALKRLGFPGVM